MHSVYVLVGSVLLLDDHFVNNIYLLYRNVTKSLYAGALTASPEMTYFILFNQRVVEIIAFPFSEINCGVVSLLNLR